jgi:phage terminase large subunit
MRYANTTATQKIAKLQKRIRAVPGGTSASKTISILINLISLAQTDKEPRLTSVVSESIPHLRKGCIRDFKSIMQSHNLWLQGNWSETNKEYKFPTGSVMEFFGADNADKLRGGRRDRLFLNEANNVTFDAFEQLEVRTRELIFLDWNPTNEFWYYAEVKGKRDDVEELTLTYKDNEALDDQTIKSIEQRKNRKNWWQVYGLGKLGEVEGRIYTGWQIIDHIPHEARLERRGLDFGYTNDPSALVDIYYYNGGFILDEIIYQKGLSNKQLADIILAQEKQVPIYADCAEPKSIDEIKSYGITILPAAKGRNSVNQGIQYVKDQRISVTQRSLNLLKEYRNYLWDTDKDGKTINKPIDIWNHSMDALRYGMDSYKPKTDNSVYIPIFDLN